jgi:hypothetical protein
MSPKTALLESNASATLAPLARATFVSLTLFCITHFIIDLYSGALGALQPLLLDQFHMSYTQAGILAGVLSFSSSVLQPGWGYLSDRFHSRLFTALAPAVAGIFISSVGLAPSYPVLLGMVFLGGAGIASFHPHAASNAIVVGFNVRPNAEAKALAEREGVDIRTYRVIYKLTEDIQQALLGMLAPEQVEEVLGEAEVRQIFRASRIGTIAGCMVTQGVIQRGAQVRVVRDGTIVFDGRIDTLKRFQDDAREVAQGFECGLTLENYNDLKEGDVLEVYAVKEVARTS